MTLDAAQRLTEILLSLAFVQQACEHLRSHPADRPLYAARLVLCVLVIAGLARPWPLAALALTSLPVLHRFQGPYNGGSDRMGLLALWSLTLSELLPVPAWREIAFGYLGAQLVLSYFISGYVKLKNPDWRSGRALAQVFAFSAYPVAEDLRSLAARPRLLAAMSWAVMLFEAAFPLSLAAQPALIAALAVAALFHLANACLFGLNRFFWTWLAVYPALLWLQDRLVG